MRRMLLIVVFVNIVQGLTVIPLRTETLYSNPNYIVNVTSSVRRHGRGSLYYINYSGELIRGIGNNITVICKFYEVLSGRYVPLPLYQEAKMCDFLNKDSFLGQLVMKQLPKNMSTCPFSAGWYPLRDLSFDTMDLPFNIPFTFAYMEQVAVLDLKAFGNHLKELELAFHERIHFRCIQKPRNKKT